jgi:hypothetical protein
MIILRYLGFIPAFILSSVIVHYLVNFLIYPTIQWLAGFIINELLSEFPENRLPENVVWWMIVIRILGSAINVFVPIYLTKKVYPNKNKKPLVISLIIFNLLFLIIIFMVFYSVFLEISFLTLNNVLIVIGVLVGCFISYTFSTED